MTLCTYFVAGVNDTANGKKVGHGKDSEAKVEEHAHAGSFLQ